MERQLAEQLLEKLNKLYNPLGDAVELVAQISDMEEQKRYKDGVAELMGRVMGVQSLIYEQYPDLYPFKIV